MELESKTVVKAPLEKVYDLVKNKLPEIVPYLPNVDKIEVLEKNEDGSKTHLVNKWYAKAEVPGVVKSFIKPELFCWKDVASWDDDSHSVNYSLESYLANDLFDANGKNSFVSLNENETELIVTCQVKIYPEKLPGVPRLLAKKVSPAVEGLIEKLLAPNLSSLGDGLNQYLEKNS
jgi:hypothetical protein